MAVQLEIDDGSPYWYLSPDIWVVPGSDPNGAPGVPIAGQASFVWARVHNVGTDPVNNATVRFYWADPSTTITENTATLIGTSFVSLLAGQSDEVLCLTPWTPGWINGGHECLIVEAFSAEDPLPPHSPDDPIDPPADRHIAQLNLNLLMPLSHLAVFAFLAGNARILRTEEVSVEVKRAPIEQLAPLRANLGLPQLPAEATGAADFGLQPYQCGDQLASVGKPEITLPVPAGARQSLALAIQWPEPAPDTGAFYVIEQHVRGRVVGGIGVLIMSPARRGRQGG